jgi:hypothetical protein
MGSKRTGRGPRRLQGILSTIAAPALRRQGFARAEVLSRWAEIVGPELAAGCQPERITFKRDGSGATLKVRVEPGLGPEIQHRAPDIIERINGYFGYRAVQALSLIQAPLQENGRHREQPTANGDDDPAEPRQPGLKGALAALGRRIAAAERQDRS